MATIAINLQSQGDELIGLANAFSLAAHNHRFAEVAGVIPQMFAAMKKSIGYLGSIDSNLAVLCYRESERMMADLKKQLQIDVPADGGSSAGGQVSDKPTT